jgi:GNAT superfamily N-acetyltransferase
MISFRPATAVDIESICAFDHIAQRESQRKEFLRRSVLSGACHIGAENDEFICYGVLNYSFYDNGFVALLYVHSGHRRRGAGAELLGHLESLCETPKLFTSTNLSNLPMQSLLTKAGYVMSGVIHNLDESDPEIVYFKQLRTTLPGDHENH